MILYKAKPEEKGQVLPVTCHVRESLVEMLEKNWKNKR